jgi:hypothetical protein
MCLHVRWWNCIVTPRWPSFLAAKIRLGIVYV